MPRNFESQFGQIDELLDEVSESATGNELLSDIDKLCAEVGTGLDSTKQEIAQWPVERKRKEAADSPDALVLNLLSMDENFNIRTLAACNANLPATSLRRLAETSNDFIRMVIANNPSAPPDILDRLIELTGEQEVLDAVKNNPNVSAVTKYKIENRI